METRVLRSFIVVAKEGSITRAADILHIAQPSLSKQMKLLEEELGQKLFRRGKYKVMLTDVGERFLVRAKEIVELSDLTLSEFASKEREISGDLSIAFADGSFTGNVVDVVNSFRSAYPKVRLLFYSGGLEYIRSLTQRNRLSYEAGRPFNGVFGAVRRYLPQPSSDNAARNAVR